MIAFDCDQCADTIRNFGFALVGACASVGIERGKTTGEMFDIWLAREHRQHSPDG